MTTPREQAHKDIFTVYRRYRLAGHIPQSALVAIVDTYNVLTQMHVACCAGAECGWELRLEIAREYLASVRNRPRYWRASVCLLGESWREKCIDALIRETGTGWPV